MPTDNTVQVRLSTLRLLSCIIRSSFRADALIFSLKMQKECRFDGFTKPTNRHSHFSICCFLDANRLRSALSAVFKTYRKRLVRIHTNLLNKLRKAVKYVISQLFVVDLKGFEPSTSRMRTNQKLCFVLIFSHFRRFCLECKWSCGLFFPL